MRYETPYGINQETALTKSALKWLKNNNNNKKNNNVYFNCLISTAGSLAPT